MTTGELCRLLAMVPPDTTVLVQIDGEICVKDGCGDRVRGNFTGCFDVDGTRMQPLFVLGQGWQTAVCVRGTQEV